jgi:hypothetical protein
MSSPKIVSRLFTVFVATGIMLGCAQVGAQTQMPNIEERVRIAQERVNDGIRLGDLTPKESGRLNRELEEVRMMIRNVRRDGVVYENERRRIRERLVVVERDIDRLRANRRRY